MEFQEATRKPFPVKVIQVTLQNIDGVAEWCKGTIEQRDTRLLGTMTKLPVILIKGLGGKTYEAALGCWVVELNGSFRSYKPPQFDATFDILPPKPVREEKDLPDEETQARVADAVAIYQDAEDQPVTYHGTDGVTAFIA